MTIKFQNLTFGKSKFNLRRIPIFLTRLLARSGGVGSIGVDPHYAIIGLLGLFLDVSLFQALFAVRIDLVVCQIGSFLAATALTCGLAARKNITGFARSSGISTWRLLGRWITVSMLVLSLRSAIFYLLTESWQWPPQAVIIIAAVISAALFFAGITVFFSAASSNLTCTRWQMITVSAVAYALLLKIVYMGLVNVMPEEAYYWNYAQRLDIGYLDHPPMVGWLIWLSTSIFGDSEFAVRIPAFISWIIAAIFMFRLTVNFCDRPAAFRSVLLLAVLPIYFGIGFFITPDSPLYAAWAGCLYFLERALIADDRRAWYGAGLCVGLGMLAKYTIALLGPGTLAFLLLDSRSRRWLLRPQPFMAVLIGAALFSPVVYWNMENGWSSFAFQGPSRWSGQPDFSLHIVLASLLLVLTPVGLLAMGKLILTDRVAGTPDADQTDSRRKQRLWLFSFTWLPLCVFVVHSLNNDSKLHWTGPVFLAALPLLAAGMAPGIGEVGGPLTRLVRRVWMPTIIGLLLIYGGVFYYFSVGLPGSPLASARAFGAWRLLTERVGQIEKVLETQTGSEPIIVGMDKYKIASETSFYDFTDRDAVKNTAGPHLFGGQSLMWKFWLPRSAGVGRNMLMIDFDRKRLAEPSLARYFDSIGEVSDETLRKNGRIVGSFHWRVGYGYRNP